MRLIILFLIIQSCVKSNNHSHVIGRWYRDSTIVDIGKERIIFDGDTKDFVDYHIHKDSTVTMKTELGESWKGKLLLVSKDSIIYRDSAFNATIHLSKIPGR